MILSAEMILSAVLTSNKKYLFFKFILRHINRVYCIDNYYLVVLIVLIIYNAYK